MDAADLPASLAMARAEIRAVACLKRVCGALEGLRWSTGLDERGLVITLRGPTVGQGTCITRGQLEAARDVEGLVEDEVVALVSQLVGWLVRQR